MYALISSSTPLSLPISISAPDLATLSISVLTVLTVSEILVGVSLPSLDPYIQTESLIEMSVTIPSPIFSL